MMSPTKVGAQFLRHQLWTGVRSMNGHGGEVFNTKSQMGLWNTLSEVIEQLWLNVCSFWEWLWESAPLTWLGGEFGLNRGN